MVVSTVSRSSDERHRLPHLAQRGELPDGALELGRALLQLGEQPRVLDGDHRLVRERLEQRDLGRRERTGLRADHGDDADDVAAASIGT